MCGIFAYLGKNINENELFEYFNKIKHRGPDNTNIKNITENILFVFHRLCINGLDNISDQPIHYNNCWLISNGEIYNYKILLEENGFKYNTNSDCEIIIHMYRKYGFKKTCEKLDGEFAFILYDELTNKLYISRDPVGIRSLYYGYNNKDYTIVVASEAKAIIGLVDNVCQFPPGKWIMIEYGKDKLDKVDFNIYYHHNYEIKYNIPEEIHHKNIKNLLIDAVDKRMLSDRKVCCLLSGGIDSTLVTALVNRHYKKGELNTYAIGLENSVDLHYARIAANYLGTNHHEVLVTEKEFLEAIDKTIFQIESFCTTTVRASVGNYLVSLYIKNNINIPSEKYLNDTVVFCGDMSDEIFASYRGFQNTKSPEAFFKENLKMVTDVHFFDVLRSDKSISGAQLEARVPFADKNLIKYVMEIDPNLKMFDNNKIEKYLLRKAFVDDNIIPKELLWRRKEAFSDGVSTHSRSWFEIIQEYVDKIIPDQEFTKRCNKYKHCTPYDKESLYYREIFEKYYPGKSKLIPYFWKQPFCNTIDPSARLLDFYET